MKNSEKTEQKAFELLHDVKEFSEENREEAIFYVKKLINLINKEITDKLNNNLYN